MSGKIKATIDQIVRVRGNGDNVRALMTATKLLLKGVDPEAYTAASPDDPAVLVKLRTIATEWGIKL
jgi:hypothetical protein